MALWGTNTYVLFTVRRVSYHMHPCILLYQDVDEFLRVPQGVTIPQLLQPGGCLHGLAYAQLSRYNYDCRCAVLLVLCVSTNTPAGWVGWTGLQRTAT